MVQGSVVVLVPQRVHIHYHYGIRSQKTIPTMVLGPYFHNRSVYGPSWFMVMYVLNPESLLPYVGFVGFLRVP